MEHTPITLFGNPNITTDFGIISILYSNGLLAMILIILALTWLMRYFSKNNMTEEIVVMLCYAGYTVLEACIDSVLMNMMLLYCSLIIFPSMIPPQCKRPAFFKFKGDSFGR